jgi:rifampicin phosphotransferase
MAAAAARREELITQARAQLHGYPQAVIEHFESMLRAAQMGVVLSEDHGFWIDFWATDAFRQVLREFGSRLAVQETIEKANDVFYLTLEEARAAVTPPFPDLQDVVTARKVEMARFQAVQPPNELGTRRAVGPTDHNPTQGSDRKLSGTTPTNSTRELIRGNSGSPGKVQGRVKVVRSLSEASKVAPGDILVAIATAPPWTPIFATVAAVVTDMGGVLGHCAVVAREYGIPAVVGTGVATAFLQDDQWVEVDGDSGTVHVLQSV